MELSLKKYLTAALKWLIPFLLLEFLIGILRLAGIAETESFALISAVNVLFLLLPGMCFLAMFFVFKKKCKSFIPAEGVIANWNSGFYRYTGSVIIKIDEKEFSTSAYFSSEECKDMVGKTVTYAIIDEILFIYAVKD